MVVFNIGDKVAFKGNSLYREQVDAEEQVGEYIVAEVIGFDGFAGPIPLPGTRWLRLRFISRPKDERIKNEILVTEEECKDIQEVQVENKAW